MFKIGIIGAMDVEVAQLKSDMKEITVTEKAGMEFCDGMLDGSSVVVVKSGVGKVNAAICTQILIDRFGVNAVINTGVAGSLDSRINIGDLVFSTDALCHDMDATIFGYKPGQVPQMNVYTFEASQMLADKAESVCRRILPQIQVWKGRVVSGDQFISDPKKKAWIKDTFDALCTEMEGAAIAQAAWANHVPFLVIRAISDKADGSDVMDYPTFENLSAQRSVRLVEALVREL